MSPAIPGIAAKIYRKSQHSLDVVIDLDDATGKVFAAIDGHAALPIVAESAGVGIPVLLRAIAKLTTAPMVDSLRRRSGPRSATKASHAQIESAAPAARRV